jgi:hypothetical protein
LEADNVNNLIYSLTALDPEKERPVPTKQEAWLGAGKKIFGP